MRASRTKTHPCSDGIRPPAQALLHPGQIPSTRLQGTARTRRTRGSLSRSPGGTLETARSRRKQSPLLADAPRLTVLPPVSGDDRASSLAPSGPGSRKTRQAPFHQRLPCESFLEASGGTTFLEPRQRGRGGAGKVTGT
ncbi:unnamed protein product [Ascophyllum nodosum]